MIRVLIADDHAILRRGFQQILVRELEDSIFGEAKDAGGTRAARLSKITETMTRVPRIHALAIAARGLMLMRTCHSSRLGSPSRPSRSC
jgi:DNA-binding NarL/FixJ family response regulator